MGLARAAAPVHAARCSMKRSFRFVLLTLCLVAGMFACKGPPSAPASRLVLLDGRVWTQQDLSGQVTLVTFWATSCATCVNEMSMLAQTYQQYRARGYRTLAVAMQYDRPSYVMNFARSRQLPFEVAIDHTGQLARDWGPIRATPTAFLVNRHGQVVERLVGPVDAHQLRQSIERLLAEQ
jgi:peroxiredoxin